MPARKTRAKNKPTTARKYTVHYLPDESGGYTAHIPALGIVTEGQTLREARAMARDAVAGYMEAARELGKPIPRDISGMVERVGVSA